ncbi:site-specific integrase [Lachnospiraceae bacterium MD329]|nr:site-specific integrase [Lachnospiraceae bacterium MD329]
MATTIPRKNKNGEIISYQIQVYRGRNADGKKLKPYSMTWKVPKGLSDKKIQKELNRVVTLFEENCHNGTVSTEKQTFEEYANYVIDLKEKGGIKPTTIYHYKKILKRLQWKSVNFENNELYLCNNLLYLPDKGIYSDTLKTNENRYVSVPQDVMDVLKQWKEEQAKIAYALDDEWTETDYVFTRENGLPMCPHNILHFFKQLEKKHNLPHIYPHKFRHSQASVLINKGVDIVTVSKRLGHSKT